MDRVLFIEAALIAPTSLDPTMSLEVSLASLPPSGHTSSHREQPTGAAPTGFRANSGRGLMPVLLSLVLTMVLPLLARADTIKVPSDQPDLYSAIIAASAGDVILVQTGMNQYALGTGWIVIDKPITIIGDPVCNIDMASGSAGVKLSGPGSGEVVLIGVNIYYGDTESTSYFSLKGGGFDSVKLISCSISHGNGSGPYSVISNYPAVDLSGVDRLTVKDSILVGGLAELYFCASPYSPDGRPGIQAPGTSVLILNSSVSGGSGGWGTNYPIFRALVVFPLGEAGVEMVSWPAMCILGILRFRAETV